MALILIDNHPGLPPGSPERTRRFYSKQLARARAFASQKHGSQRYGEHEYLYHLDMVARLTCEYALHPKFTIGAYLHDTLEDTDTTMVELIGLFGEEIAQMVESVSGFGETREESRSQIIQKLKRRPAFAPLKLLDRLANVETSIQEGKSSLVQMYRKEMPFYQQIFVQAHKLAYQRLCSALNWQA